MSSNVNISTRHPRPALTRPADSQPDPLDLDQRLSATKPRRTTEGMDFQSPERPRRNE